MPKKDSKKVKRGKMVRFSQIEGRPPHSSYGVLAIVEAIKIMGGTSALARALDLTPSSVSIWLRGGTVAAHRAIQIEHVTKGAVKKEQLRPDIFSGEAGK